MGFQSGAHVSPTSPVVKRYFPGVGYDDPFPAVSQYLDPFGVLSRTAVSAPRQGAKGTVFEGSMAINPPVFSV